jgi:hypothetical protein
LSKRALMILTWVITIVWVANFIAGFAYPTATSASVNAVFMFVVGMLYRSISKKGPDEPPGEIPPVEPGRNRKEMEGEQP